MPSNPSNFSFPILKVAKTGQDSNGLRHSDHLRYRQYCSRRLARLYKTSSIAGSGTTLSLSATVAKAGKNQHTFQTSKALLITTSLLKTSESSESAAASDSIDNNKGSTSEVTCTDENLESSSSDLNRELEILLLNAERAWSHAAQLRSDNSVKQRFSPQLRNHSVRRLAKASFWAKKLKTVCEKHGDNRTIREAEAYEYYLQGWYMYEQENWSRAAESFKKSRNAYEKLALATAENTLYKTMLTSELDPLIKKASYNAELLGADPNQMVNNQNLSSLSKDSTSATSDTNVSTTVKLTENMPIIKTYAYRGNSNEKSGANCRSKEIAEAIDTCLKLRKELEDGETAKLLNELETKTSFKNYNTAGSGPNANSSNTSLSSSDSSLQILIEKHGEIGLKFQDSLTQLHNLVFMIDQSSNNLLSKELSMLDAVLRDYLASTYVERDLLLLARLFARLDFFGLSQIQGALVGCANEQKQKLGVKPEEAVRFIDKVKMEFIKIYNINSENSLNSNSDSDNTMENNSAENGGTVESDESKLPIELSLLLKNCRGFFVGLCYLSCGQTAQAACVLDLVNDRVKTNDIEKVELGLGLPLDRSERILNLLAKNLSEGCTNWYARSLSFLAKERFQNVDHQLLHTTVATMGKSSRNYNKNNSSDSKSNFKPPKRGGNNESEDYFPHNLQPEAVAMKPFFQDLANNLLTNPRDLIEGPQGIGSPVETSGGQQNPNKSGAVAGAIGKVAEWFGRR